MIDITTESLRLLNQATADVPGRPHISTLIRWWRRGVRGVKLETVLVGGRRYTSLEAIQRFVKRQSKTDSYSAGPLGSTCATRIAKELDEEGL
jgi:hypothetical protein